MGKVGHPVNLPAIAVFTAMQASAWGYLIKGADREQVLGVIRAVVNGEALFSPAIARKLNRLEAAPQAFPELTEREREILSLIASGMNNSQISERLVISPKTVRNHIGNIFDKLQVADRAQAIIRAREAGLGQGRH